MLTTFPDFEELGSSLALSKITFEISMGWPSWKTGWSVQTEENARCADIKWQDWLLNDFFQLSKKIKTCKKFGILFVTSIPTKLSLSLKMFWELSMEKAHLRAIKKKILCDQKNFRNGKFFKSEIFCVVNNQQPNVRQYVIFYKELVRLHEVDCPIC